ncbi:hypothetical protein EMIT0P2_70096 [Pseudomonas sp. IT-P2]
MKKTPVDPGFFVPARKALKQLVYVGLQKSFSVCNFPQGRLTSRRKICPDFERKVYSNRSRPAVDSCL